MTGRSGVMLHFRQGYNIIPFSTGGNNWQGLQIFVTMSLIISRNMTFIYIAEVYPTYDILTDSTLLFDNEFYWNVVIHF